MENLKSWLERPDNPGSYYELLDCPCFCNDRERLLTAVRVATRFLHPYENHKTNAIVRRARSLQLLCATAGHTFADNAKWHAYDSQLKQRLRDEYYAEAADSDVRRWLRDRRGVDPNRIDEIALFIVTPSGAAPSSTPIEDHSKKNTRDSASESSATPHGLPPAIPTSQSGRKPPPLPPRQSPRNSSAAANAGDPSETALALNAVTMPLPVLPATPKVAARPMIPPALPGVAPQPPMMSGQTPQKAIQQAEASHMSDSHSPQRRGRAKAILWLSGIFVAMAVVGIIVLLLLGPSPRKSARHKEASENELLNRPHSQIVLNVGRIRVPVPPRRFDLG